MKKSNKLIIIGVSLIFVSLLLMLMIFNRATNTIEKNATLDMIDCNSSKVNVFVFWGDGCPHCKKEFEYLEKISKRYSSYFDVYGFETWFNEDNSKMMNKFRELIKDEASGIPYTIVGDKVFHGFANEMQDELLNTIIEEYKSKDKTNYCEKIKKEFTTNNKTE